MKARRSAIDQVDLLLQLRHLLRDDLEARGFYQGLFDHVRDRPVQRRDPQVVAHRRAAPGRGRVELFDQDGERRLEPIGVVVPHSVEDGAQAVAALGAAGIPILPRGSGTALAGQTVNDLRAMRGTLADLVERCRGDERPDCPILRSLEA